MKRNLLFLAALCCCLAAAAETAPLLDVTKLDPNMTVRPPAEDNLRFVGAYEAPIRLTGFEWFGTDGVYRRLPKKPAVPFPRALENLAWHTAGGQVAFRSDTSRIVLKVKLRGSANMYHMPATGSSGFDLYIGPPGQKRYFKTASFNAGAAEYTAQLFKVNRGVMREFTLNFPLYNGVESVFIGIDQNAVLEAPAPWADPRPVVCYGTSILQGGCASRPGMAYTNLLSRRFNRPFINLGFSGNGKGEAEVAAEIAQIKNPAMFIVDYEANSGGLAKYRETLPVFLNTLRKNHPTTPILLISGSRRAYEAIDQVRGRDSRPQRARDSVAFQQELVKTLQKSGDKQIHFFNGDDLLGADWDECSVDGSHPTDLGFLRMAEALTPTLQKIFSTP